MTERLTVRDIDLDVLRCGAGRPLLLLHGFDPVPSHAPFLERLGAHAEVVAPSHPGFGRSSRPDAIDSVYDLVRVYLDVLDRWPAERVAVLGLSFGGWLAAELASISSSRIERLVLVDAVGIKVSPPDTPDIYDVFNRSPHDVHRRRWHDPDRWKPDFDAMADEELIAHHRNRESLCRYAWHPYMHNPKLRPWLGRIDVPTLVLWGASDGIVSPDYGRAYSAAIPGSRFELIEDAGHHPELEQPELFVDRVVAFLKE